MFADDIALITEQITKYGLLKPMADLGGLPRPTIADYAITIRTGIQKSRYIQLPPNVRPFDTIDATYKIFNPEFGDPPIEQMLPKHAGQFGTIVCLSVLEHVENPFEIFSAFRELLKPGGLLICSTVFSFPKHNAPRDFWRFSDDCLRMLAKQAGLQCLEAGFRLEIFGDAGVRDIHTNAAQEIRSTYVTARK